MTKGDFSRLRRQERQDQQARGGRGGGRDFRWDRESDQEEQTLSGSRLRDVHATLAQSPQRAKSANRRCDQHQSKPHCRIQSRPRY